MKQQVFNDEVSGKVVMGDVVHCHGAETCPLKKTRESDLQAAFYKSTGIWAPPGARDALEKLMRDNGFTAPRLKMAWQANSLVWDDNHKVLVAKTFWLEPIYGYGIVTLLMVFLVMQTVGLIFSTGVETWRTLAITTSALLIYLGVVWLSLRFVLIPYRVAQRVNASAKGKTLS